MHWNLHFDQMAQATADPTQQRAGIAAVDMAPIAIAADEHLNAAVWLRAQKKPGMRQVIMVATAAFVMLPPMTWTRTAVATKMPLQSAILDRLLHHSHVLLRAERKAGV
jgi:hypothetical protein